MMKALVNKSRISALNKNAEMKTKTTKSKESMSMNYDLSNIEFVGSNLEGSVQLFGKEKKEVFIFKIKDTDEFPDINDADTEAFLVIACK